MKTVPTRTATAPSDRDAKLARVWTLLDQLGVPAIQFTSQESLAWLFDGARVTVPIGGSPVLTAVVDRNGITAHAHANEVDRLRDEELGDAERLDLVAVPWHHPLPRAVGIAQEDAHPIDVQRLRSPLTPGDLARYRALGRDAAGAMTAVLQSARPGQSEQELAAELARAAVAIGADPVVLLVAGEGRRAVRHPLPTAAALGARAMAVLGARRSGLFANLTRWVAFRDDPAAAATDRRLLEVEADAFAATAPGRSIGEVLTDIAAAYERHGFGRDAWLGHHQGGPTGYLGREPRATPDSREPIVAGRAFAWNPSAPGAKVEDTVLLTDGGIEVLTADPAWPTTDVRGIARPVALAVDGR